MINADVGKIRREEKLYIIQVNTGAIESLKLALAEKYMVEFDEKDFFSIPICVC